MPNNLAEHFISGWRREAEAAPERTPRMSAGDRYSRDATFRSFVDVLYHMLTRLEMTPTEVREAAMFATMKYEALHVKPFVVPREMQDAVTRAVSAELSGKGEGQ